MAITNTRDSLVKYAIYHRCGHHTLPSDTTRIKANKTTKKSERFYASREIEPNV
jgi:hypothetical protein